MSKVVWWLEAINRKNKTGVMIALQLPKGTANGLALQQDALPTGSEPLPPGDFHLTLAFLGTASEMIVDRLEVLEALALFAAQQPPLTGRLNGLGAFIAQGGKYPLYINFDCAELPEFRQDLIAALAAVGVEVNGAHGFTPHVTLAYVPEGVEVSGLAVPDKKVTFDRVGLFWGGQVEFCPLKGDVTMSTRTKEGVRKLTDVTSHRVAEAVIGEERTSDGGFLLSGVVIAEGMSANGNLYTLDALKSGIMVFRDRAIYADHPSRSEESDRPERSVRDLVGRLSESGDDFWIERNKHGTNVLRFRNAKLSSTAGWLATMIKERIAGDMSINAMGSGEDIDGVFNVLEFTEATSLDFVTVAAAGGLGTVAEGDRSRSTEIDLPGLTVTRLAAARPDIVNTIAARERRKAYGERDEFRQMRRRVKEQEAAMDRLEAARQKAEAEATMERVLASSGLPGSIRRAVRGMCQRTVAEHLNLPVGEADEYVKPFKLGYFVQIVSGEHAGKECTIQLSAGPRSWHVVFADGSRARIDEDDMKHFEARRAREAEMTLGEYLQKAGLSGSAEEEQFFNWMIDKGVDVNVRKDSSEWIALLNEFEDGGKGMKMSARRTREKVYTITPDAWMKSKHGDLPSVYREEFLGWIEEQGHVEVTAGGEMVDESDLEVWFDEWDQEFSIEARRTREQAFPSMGPISLDTFVSKINWELDEEERFRAEIEKRLGITPADRSVEEWWSHLLTFMNFDPATRARMGAFRPRARRTRAAKTMPVTFWINSADLDEDEAGKFKAWLKKEKGDAADDQKSKADWKALHTEFGKAGEEEEEETEEAFAAYKVKVRQEIEALAAAAPLSDWSELADAAADYLGVYNADGFTPGWVRGIARGVLGADVPVSADAKRDAKNALLKHKEESPDAPALLAAEDVADLLDLSNADGNAPDWLQKMAEGIFEARRGRHRLRTSVDEMIFNNLKARMRWSKDRFDTPEELLDAAIDEYNVGGELDQGQDTDLLDYAYELMGGYEARRGRRARSREVGYMDTGLSPDDEHMIQTWMLDNCQPGDTAETLADKALAYFSGDMPDRAVMIQLAEPVIELKINPTLAPQTASKKPARFAKPVREVAVGDCALIQTYVDGQLHARIIARDYTGMWVFEDAQGRRHGVEDSGIIQIVDCAGAGLSHIQNFRQASSFRATEGTIRGRRVHEARKRPARAAGEGPALSLEGPFFPLREFIVREWGSALDGEQSAFEQWVVQRGEASQLYTANEWNEVLAEWEMEQRGGRAARRRPVRRAREQHGALVSVRAFADTMGMNRAEEADWFRWVYNQKGYPFVEEIAIDILDQWYEEFLRSLDINTMSSRHRVSNQAMGLDQFLREAGVLREQWETDPWIVEDAAAYEQAAQELGRQGYSRRKGVGSSPDYFEKWGQPAVILTRPLGSHEWTPREMGTMAGAGRRAREVELELEPGMKVQLQDSRWVTVSSRGVVGTTVYILEPPGNVHITEIAFPKHPEDYQASRSEAEGFRNWLTSKDVDPTTTQAPQSFWREMWRQYCALTGRRRGRVREGGIDTDWVDIPGLGLKWRFDYYFGAKQGIQIMDTSGKIWPELGMVYSVYKPYDPADSNWQRAINIVQGRESHRQVFRRQTEASTGRVREVTPPPDVVANAMRDAGFSVEERGFDVVVSLNRPVTTGEVWGVLMDHGVDRSDIKQQGDQVIVTTSYEARRPVREQGGWGSGYSPSDYVEQDARGISSGTMATLTGYKQFTDLDAVQWQFVQFVQQNPGPWKNWMRAWDAFAQGHSHEWPNPKPVTAAMGMASRRAREQSTVPEPSGTIAPVNPELKPGDPAVIELPPDAAALPEEAQMLWLETYITYLDGGEEQAMHRAWSAVYDDGWEQDESGRWTKTQVTEMIIDDDTGGVLDIVSLPEEESVRRAREKKHTAAWHRCVDEVKKGNGKYNPYAVCTWSVDRPGGEEVYKSARRPVGEAVLTLTLKDADSIEDDGVLAEQMRAAGVTAIRVDTETWEIEDIVEEQPPEEPAGPAAEEANRQGSSRLWERQPDDWTEEEKRALIDRSTTMTITLDGKPASIGGAKTRFANVGQVGGPLQVEYSWDAVQSILDKGGQFVTGAEEARRPVRAMSPPYIKSNAILNVVNLFRIASWPKTSATLRAIEMYLTTGSLPAGSGLDARIIDQIIADAADYGLSAMLSSDRPVREQPGMTARAWGLDVKLGEEEMREWLAYVDSAGVTGPDEEVDMSTLELWWNAYLQSIGVSPYEAARRTREQGPDTPLTMRDFSRSTYAGLSALGQGGMVFLWLEKMGHLPDERKTLAEWDEIMSGWPLPWESTVKHAWASVPGVSPVREQEGEEGTGEETPKVTFAEFVEQKGIDGDQTDAFRAWLDEDGMAPGEAKAAEEWEEVYADFQEESAEAVTNEEESLHGREAGREHRRSDMFQDLGLDLSLDEFLVDHPNGGAIRAPFEGWLIQESGIYQRGGVYSLEEWQRLMAAYERQAGRGVVSRRRRKTREQEEWDAGAGENEVTAEEYAQHHITPEDKDAWLAYVEKKGVDPEERERVDFWDGLESEWDYSHQESRRGDPPESLEDKLRKVIAAARTEWGGQIDGDLVRGVGSGPGLPGDFDDEQLKEAFRGLLPDDALDYVIDGR